MPRKTDYNEQIKNRIVTALKLGHFIIDACMLAGISTQSYYKWYNLGVDGDERYTDFTSAVDEAQAEAINNALGNIRAAGERDWKAEAWFIERRNKLWQKIDKLEVGGDDEKPIKIKLKWADDLSKESEEIESVE